MKLFTYWRSTAAYRIRIALNLKQLDYHSESIHLVKDGGEQHLATYQQVNPQSLVPTLVTDQGVTITQSMAIMEYLEEAFPEVPILPKNLENRAACRSLAQIVVADIHPLNNLRVLQYLKGCDWQPDQVDAWYAHWIHQGFQAMETIAKNRQTSYLNADHPCVSDICLVAQIYNANRFQVPLTAYPNLLAINDYCLELDEFQQAMPENQFDAV